MLDQTKNNETAIRMQIIVHTGPKSQFGRTKNGLAKEECHVGIEDAVKKLPMAAAAKHTIKETTNFISFEIFITNEVVFWNIK